MDLVDRIQIQSDTVRSEASQGDGEAEQRQRPRPEIVAQVCSDVPASGRYLRAEVGGEEFDRSGRGGHCGSPVGQLQEQTDDWGPRGR